MRIVLRLDGSIARLRRRAWASQLVRELSLHLALALFAAGAIALGLRFGLRWSRPDAALALWLVALAPLSAFLRARPGLLSRRGAEAWLDVRSGGSGLVVTAAELDDPLWRVEAERRLAGAPAPPRLRLARPLLKLVPALGFAAGALVVEPPPARAGTPQRAVLGVVERIEEKLATLEETLQLDPAEAEELHARLERLRAEAGEARPEASFEAVDRLEERLEALAREALDEAERARGELAAGSGQDLEAEQAALERALETLSRSALARELPESLRGKLDASLRLPEGLELSEAELAGMSQELRELLAARLGELAQAGLLKPGELRRVEQLASLEGFQPTEHVCDEDCLKPGGT
jgi:hypothetical protein